MTEWKEWSEQEVAFLKENFGKMTYADLALALRGVDGRRFTRCAIAGKVKRLGLTGARQLMVQRKPKPAKPRHAAFLARAPKTKKEPSVVRMKPSEQQDQIRFYAEPCDDNVVLLKTKAHHCRWPISFEPGADMLCCGRPIREGSYCEFHYWESTRRSEGLPANTQELRVAYAERRKARA